MSQGVDSLRTTQRAKYVCRSEGVYPLDQTSQLEIMVFFWNESSPENKLRFQTKEVDFPGN